MRRTLYFAGLSLVGLLSSSHAAICLAQSTHSQPADAASPSTELRFDEEARRVLDRSAEVQYGSIAATRSITGLRLKGQMSIPAQGIAADIEVVQSQGKLLTVLTIPGLGQMTEGFTGEHAWSFSELQGPALKSGAEAVQSREQADLYASLDWEKYFSSVRYIGREEIDDYDGNKTDTHVLEMTTTDGERTSTAYFEVNTGHQIRTDAEVIVQGTKLPTTALMGDFRSVDGLTLPHKTKSTFGPMQQIITLSAIETNPTVDPSVFDVPAEVAALIESDTSSGK